MQSKQATAPARTLEKEAARDYKRKRQHDGGKMMMTMMTTMMMMMVMTVVVPIRVVMGKSPGGPQIMDEGPGGPTGFPK